MPTFIVQAEADAIRFAMKLVASGVVVLVRVH